jgi:TonB-dependent SusC/RagA subfamily outer membrane receptor
VITAIALYALAMGGLLAVGALLLERVAQWAALPQRFVWLGALGLLVGLTIIAPWRMAPAAAPVTAKTPAAPSASLPDGFALPADVAGSGVPAQLRQAIEHLARRVPPSIDRALGIAWATSSALLLALLLLLLRRLDQARHRWPKAELLGTPVRLSERDGPAIYGVVAMDIVVPRALLARSAAEQEVVLSHEREHRGARDPLVLALATALVTLVPWNPAAWWFLSRLRLATELDCDARVLNHGVSVRRYGEALLTLAATLPPPPRAAQGLALFASPRNLHRRLLAMTAPSTRRSPILTAALALAGTAVAFVACTADVPTAAEVRDADVTAITQALDLPTEPGTLRFLVDGQNSTEADARALTPEEIASIEVLRSDDPAQQGQIRIIRRAEGGASGTGGPRVLSAVPMGSDSTAPMTLALRLDGPAPEVVPGLQPIVIVDGEIAEAPNALRAIRPDQIERIEVLKGEAAVAIYGERGVNGAIHVTTKR